MPKRITICFGRVRDPLDIVRGAGRDLVEHELLGRATAERHRDLLLQRLLRLL